MNKLRTQMRWIMIAIALAFLLSTFLMYDSGSRGGVTQDGGVADYAVAEVNGRALMLSTVYENLRMMIETGGDRELTSMDYQAVLESYAVESQLAQEVRDSGVTVTAEEVDQAMKDYIDMAFPTRESFYQELERSGTKLEDFKTGLEAQMIRQKFIEESVGEVVVSEDEAVDFYDGMKNIFYRQPAGYMANMARLKSQAEAGKVRALLVSGYEWNEATSADVVASPDVVYVTEEPMYFADGAFDGYLSPVRSADVGAVSPVFEVASDDFAVVVKTERVEEKITAYDEVSEDIRQMLRQQKTSDAVNGFSAGLLSRAEIEILDPSLFPAGQEFEPVEQTEPVRITSGDAQNTAVISEDN